MQKGQIFITDDAGKHLEQYDLTCNIEELIEARSFLSDILLNDDNSYSGNDKPILQSLSEVLRQSREKNNIGKTFFVPTKTIEVIDDIIFSDKGIDYSKIFGSLKLIEINELKSKLEDIKRYFNSLTGIYYRQYLDYSYFMALERSLEYQFVESYTTEYASLDIPSLISNPKLALELPKAKNNKLIIDFNKSIIDKQN